MDNCYTNFTANEESFDDESEEKKDVYEELPQPNRESYSEWIYKGNNGFYPSKYLDIRKKLPNGYYIFKFSSRENTHYLEKQNFFTDNLIDLPIPELQAVKRDIIKFWESKDIFDKYDLVYKRGILLHGPGGCGKTAMIEIILKDLIEKRDGIVFKINSSDTLSDYDQSFNNMIRDIEPNRKVITVIEDIDGLLTEKDDEKVFH